MSQPIKLAIIPGDGIGPEVVAQAERVLDAVALADGIQFEKTRYWLGAERYLETGDTLSDEDLLSLSEQDVILFGAAGGKPGDERLKGANIERGLLLKLRFDFDQYVNLRPSKLYPGAISPLANPGEIDFVVVREGTEGPYVGNGGAIRVGTEFELANETSINTAYGVERVIRYAFELASKRRQKLTLVHKTNVLVFAGALWKRLCDAVALEYPQVEVEYIHVDAATIFLVTNPERFDVIVTDNLFGDILTDLAGAVTGGIGLAASGNINPSAAFPSMFEPVHGSAPDIAGQGKADPSAAILSAAMLLEHLGFVSAGEKIQQAVAADQSSLPEHTRSTSEVGDAILAQLAELL